MSDLEKTAGDADDDAREMEEPTAVESPVEEDETSPEGIPADSESTGVQDVDDPSSDESAKPSADAGEEPPREEADEDDAEDEGPPPQSRLIHNPPQSLPWRIARLALAPILAGAAFGVHMWLNVPEDAVIEQLRAQGKKKKGGRKGRPRPPRRQKMDPRSADELDAAFSEWEGKPFDDEPPNGRWPRDMQTMINKAVVVARKAAFEGAPEEPRVIVTGTQCRTIRCRFVLRSPFEHEVQMLAKAIEGVHYDGEPMWRSFTTQPVDPPTNQSPEDDVYLEVTVAVTQDGYESTLIEYVPPDD